MSQEQVASAGSPERVEFRTTSSGATRASGTATSGHYMTVNLPSWRSRVELSQNGLAASGRSRPFWVRGESAPALPGRRCTAPGRCLAPFLPTVAGACADAAAPFAQTRSTGATPIAAASLQNRTSPHTDSDRDGFAHPVEAFRRIQSIFSLVFSPEKATSLVL